MTPTPSASLTAQDRAIAAWESATMLSLGPVLSDAQADAAWRVIVQQRTGHDADAFAEALREIIDQTVARQREIVQSVTDNLRAVLASHAAV